MTHQSDIFVNIFDYVNTLSESCGVQSEEIDELAWVAMQPPKTVDHEPHQYFENNHRICAEPSHVFSIPECAVYGNEGLIISNKNRIISTGIMSATDLEDWPDYFQAQNEAERVTGTVAFITGRWVRNYFHWMTESVAKFRLLEKSEAKIDKYYLKYDQDFQYQSLKRLGLAPHKLINSRDVPSIHVDELVVPERGGRRNTVSRQTISYLRDMYLHGNDNELEKTERIYISRGTRRRRIVNENELLELLVKYGFKPKMLETLSISEQADLFARAEVVVSPHGAGLTNLTFCHTGTKVIELFAHGYISGIYWLISHHTGLDYYYVIGDKLIHNTKVKDWDQDIKIDITKVEATLKYANISRGDSD